MSPDIQMFRHGFFPASFNRPKTVFTFGVLNDFILDNLECGTSAMNYYSKLWQMTSSMFPHLVPLMRVARQIMKWHGFGHRSDTPSTGELALFCPACPQPGINVLLSGDESLDETPSWKFTWSFVMDGNFKAEHLHPIKPFDEVWLSDGLGFMVGKDRYKMHLEEAADMDSCYVRYASNFIEGIGQIDREIMETLWARLNLISPAARGMSSLHRKECLDYQMNDLNFCKMIRVKRTLC
ncbi:hypothetical protein BDR05DRAFT_978930 [Suillus weaverae]|nr:hypothetical protein BDR05DRAFT_978930 [Suillus weaverae]